MRAKHGDEHSQEHLGQALIESRIFFVLSVLDVLGLANYRCCKINIHEMYDARRLLKFFDMIHKNVTAIDPYRRASLKRKVLRLC